jgi:hypothetical protein
VVVPFAVSGDVVIEPDEGVNAVGVEIAVEQAELVYRVTVEASVILLRVTVGV